MALMIDIIDMSAGRGVWEARGLAMQSSWRGQARRTIARNNHESEKRAAGELAVAQLSTCHGGGVPPMDMCTECGNKQIPGICFFLVPHFVRGLLPLQVLESCKPFCPTQTWPQVNSGPKLAPKTWQKGPRPKDFSLFSSVPNFPSPKDSTCHNRLLSSSRVRVSERS